MPPKTAELATMLFELRELVETGDEKAADAVVRIEARLLATETRLVELEKAAALQINNRPPDTVYSLALGAFRDLAKDALGMRIFLTGALAVILFLGLAALRVIELHPEIVPGYISAKAQGERHE